MTDDSNPKKADDARRLILARRARFIAAALASVAVTGAGAEACGGSTEPEPTTQDAGPRPCLDPPNTSSSSSSSSGTPQPCLAPPLPEDAGPKPCLDVAYDAGPQPCLSPPAPDSGP